MTKLRIRKVAGPVLAIALFLLAMRLLVHEARQITWEEFVRGLTGVPASQILMAAFLIALNYVLLISYDILALRYVAKSMPLRRVALVSIAGFSLGNNLGTLMAAAPIRFRFYSQWGLTPGQIVAVIAVLGLTFWSGLWFLGGLVLIWVPIELPQDLNLPFGTQTLGLMLFGLAVSYALVCILWRKPWPIGELHLRPPRPGLMGVQASVAAVDLLISATGLYLVLPADSVVPFAQVLAAYLIAIGVSMMTQVPGGLGILELILLTLLKSSVGDTVLASILIFRVLYYWLPLLAGMIALVGYEIHTGAIEARTARQLATERAAGGPITLEGDAPPEGSGETQHNAAENLENAKASEKAAASDTGGETNTGPENTEKRLPTNG